MLIVNNLKFCYDKISKPYIYNLTVKKGEICCVMGKSGSGKSTFLDILAGFLDPLCGSVKLNDKELLALPIEKRDISILFQSHNLFEYLSVEKNIAVGFNGSFKITSIKRKQIKDILNKMNIGGYEKKLVSNLSGGEQQRVALSRVLVQNRDILLLDEPFNGLDIETKKEILTFVKMITKEKQLHTIMVTHDILDAKYIANKIYKMDNNELKYFKQIKK